jgi:hypothetical protein
MLPQSKKRGHGVKQTIMVIGNRSNPTSVGALLLDQPVDRLG